ncbi:MAG TPA: Do family serine endopeptidase [Burkholderiales bacterium]|nr:Do family serine endopeptidase [Burkholderiales bacterium]
MSYRHLKDVKEEAMPPKKTAAAFGLSALIALGLAGIGALAVNRAAPMIDRAQAAQVAPVSPTQQPPRSNAQMVPDFASIAQQYGPAVVNITVTGTHKTGFPGRGGKSDDDEEDSQDPFQQFFRGLPFRFETPPSEVPMQGQGSGFVVSSDGIVLTNAHVVREAREVTVKLTDRREFQAKVLGFDPATDIAVLRIDAKNLPTVKAGKPEATRVGDWVLAIGSPFGFENSVSAGIVSAKGRSLPGETSVPFLQTDVAVNPGNSGGPLFNLQGEVIGINSQIYSRSGGYMGVSFAIPIDVALRVKDQIVSTGKASHARLGVAVQQVDQALAESFGLKQAEGAVVSTVVPGSAAAKAGLQPGDVILKFNGKPIGAAGELSALVGQAVPGEKAKLEVWRKGETREVNATLGEAETQTAEASDKGSPSAESGGLGLAVRPLTAEERQAAKVAEGVLVERAGGAAARAGIQRGDIVVAADGKPVKAAQDLRAAAGSGKKAVALLVQRGETRIFVPVRMG